MNLVLPPPVLVGRDQEPERGLDCGLVWTGWTGLAQEDRDGGDVPAAPDPLDCGPHHGDGPRRLFRDVDSRLDWRHAVGGDECAQHVDEMTYELEPRMRFRLCTGFRAIADPHGQVTD